MHTQATSRLIGPVYDLKLTKTKTGRDLITFTMKTWRQSRNGEDKVCWWKVIAYEGSARTLSRHMHDGRVLVVDGHMDLFNESGSEKFQIITEKFYFLGWDGKLE
jgi:single-stranded DNA-binding protein